MGCTGWRAGTRAVPSETETPLSPVSGLQRRSQEPVVSYEKWEGDLEYSACGGQEKRLWDWAFGDGRTHAGTQGRVGLGWLDNCRRRGLDPTVSQIPSDQTDLRLGPDGRGRGGGAGLRGPLTLRCLQEDVESRDIYDRHLTQAEIQGHVSQANSKRDRPGGRCLEAQAEASGCPRGLGQVTLKDLGPTRRPGTRDRVGCLGWAFPHGPGPLVFFSPWGARSCGLGAGESEG